MPARDIKVIDTRSLSMGQGFMVMAAARAAEEGRPVLDILALVEGMHERIYFYGILPTLKYLAMRGWVSQVAAGISNVISIKPVLTIRDGKLDLLERVHTLRKAWARVIELSNKARLLVRSTNLPWYTLMRRLRRASSSPSYARHCLALKKLFTRN